MKLPALFAHVWILFVAVTVLDAVMGVSETGTTVTRS